MSPASSSITADAPAEEESALASTIESEENLDPKEVLIPRVLYYKTFGKHPGVCPRCKHDLQQQESILIVSVQFGGEEVHSFLFGKFLWFCHDCPTAVIHPEKLRDSVHESFKEKKDKVSAFLPIGLVNEKDLIKLQDHSGSPESEEDPLDVVPFTDHKTFGRGSKSIRTPGAKRKSRRK